MKAIFFLLALSVPIQSIASEDDVDFAVSVMVVSKTAGMCGMVSQMTRFQESTKINGGDEFIERFIKSELGRLDLTPQEFVDHCSKSIESYNKLKETFESAKSKKQ
ncbi:hypothetical protein JC794_08480 [Morganella morganii]|uniref:hypothetical protein n=1 Tax=Morganella morganii TaxID=582 RepID=UPI001C4825CC|nr:hypothetical protein [Morganella morganii]QXO59313.1 hypothetical protein JC827_08470 [Morganella morganii]QXO78282.1 hypothetical protein JC794_08480 [Morganella morganii]